MTRTLATAALISLVSSSAMASTCEYYIGYIQDESEREWAIKKMYQYTPERLDEIRALKDRGAALCASGDEDEGKKTLLEAVKLISFTRLK